MINTVKTYLQDFRASVKNFLTELKPMKRPFLILLVVFFLAIIPIVRANFYYIDDLGRSVWGYREWAKTFSRHLSDFFSIFVHTDSRLSDISPLTQFIAVVFMAASGAITSYIFSDKKKVSVVAVLAAIPMALSPYYLECFSYKFDAPYMAMSVFVSVLPFLFYEKHPALYISISFVTTVAMCSLYQSSSGIYPMVVIFLCFKLWNNKQTKKAFKLLLYSVASFLAGMVFFKLFLMKTVETYVSNTMFPLKEIIPGFFGNLIKYYQIMVSDFRTLWLLVIAVCFVAFVIAAVLNSSRNKLLSLVISVVTLAVACCVAFGAYPLLRAPLFNPRAMYGFGVLLALVCVTVCSSKKWRFMSAVCIVLSWCFFVFSFIYGNALSVQKDYTELRMQMVIEDLNHLNAIDTDSVKNLKFEGAIPKAPEIRGTNIQMLNRLVPSTFGGGWVWSQNYFFYHTDIKNVKSVNELSVSTDELELVVDSVYHTIYADDENILVRLK